MKKLFVGLGLIALLAGCASHDNGMGGTGDESNQSMGSSSSDQFQENASVSAATNNPTSTTGTVSP